MLVINQKHCDPPQKSNFYWMREIYSNDVAPYSLSDCGKSKSVVLQNRVQTFFIQRERDQVTVDCE